MFFCSDNTIHFIKTEVLFPMNTIKKFIHYYGPYSVFQIWCVTDKQALTSHKCYYFYLTFMGVGVFFCCPLKRLPLQNVERKGERT